MARRRFFFLLFSLFLFVGLLGGASDHVQTALGFHQTELFARPQEMTPGNQNVQDVGGIIINEVMPRPVYGQHDWIELYRPRTAFVQFHPLVFPGSAGGYTRIGDHSIAPSGLDIRGWIITDRENHVYTIPEALPPVPVDAYVLIYFDGLGPAADDYDFSDGVAVLHTPPGLVDIFDDDADQVALYANGLQEPDALQDFVAYGDAPGQHAFDAVQAGIWSETQAVRFHIGSGAAPEGTLVPNRSIGLYPGHRNGGPEDWAVYEGEDLSPGARNPIPRSTWATAADGAVMGSDGFALGWNLTPGATYQFQMDDDPNFTSPQVDTLLEQPWYAPKAPPPAGTYWWRVRALTKTAPPSAWSTPRRVTILAVGDSQSNPQALSVSQQRVLTMTWLRQRKDSPLLCLDGDNEGNPSAPAPKETWDAEHPDNQIYVHGRNNCVRASIAMIVTHYGGQLSQDRLSYQLFENWGHPIEDRGGVGTPAVDLGHDRPTFVCGSTGSSARTLLAWALGVNNSSIVYGSTKPSFSQIRNWIDAGRPIMRFDGVSHQTVIGGYRVLSNGTQQIRLFDPWSGLSWENYSNINVGCYYVPPASAPNVRSDESGIWRDSDGDGINDWDESNRFGTDPSFADSDGDWVQDKQDIREYVFNTAGQYHLRDADIDGDNLRKELDPDNDGDSSVDGCEDTNYNGKYEPNLGETDNFDAASHQACVPQFEILQPTQTTPVNAGDHTSPDKILIQVKTATPPSSPVTFTAADFRVEIGGRLGTVVAAYRVSDSHFLVVTPPTQSTADYYDLRVTLQGTQTATETRAVYYLPKLRADQVIVLDRSGSMSDYGKLEAAKNAARAFIDHANIGDMISVVSFASSATVHYPLTTISGSAQWNAAKTAVNALVAGGYTALGQGARTGYDQLQLRGQKDHDWSMVLLSDGMENVSPYWADSSVSGVIVPSKTVVHTVALGRDADTMLLAAIAGQTGGMFYEAGTDLLPTQLSQSASMSGPSLPKALSNRLTDIYKSVGEVIGHQQRLWERTGTVVKLESFEVPVEKGLPEGIFFVNWESVRGYIRMNLRDPDGISVQPGYPNMVHQEDATHQQYRIQNPKPGVWTVTLESLEGPTEYLFILSGRSNTTMHVALGLKPQERFVGAHIPILAVLTDEKPILNAEVWALVQGPGEGMQTTIQLFDDGAHADGRADDGVYGNIYTGAIRAGGYLVKATGRGYNNAGEPFVRHASTGFMVRPRIAYIWRTDFTTALAFQELLQQEGFTVDLIPMAQVAQVRWNRYSLAIVGADSNEGSLWGTQEAIDNLLEYQIPLLGLGEGGYTLFGQLELDIGAPNGWHGHEASTIMVDPEHPVWNMPYLIKPGDKRIVQVYQKTQHIGIYMLKPPNDVVLIGQEPESAVHYNLLQQGGRFMLWGFQAGPDAMTETGRHLFINVVSYLIR